MLFVWLVQMVDANSIAAVSARLHALEDRFNSLDVNVASSRSRMSSQINDVEATVSAAQFQISSLDSRVRSQDERLSLLTGEPLVAASVKARRAMAPEAPDTSEEDEGEGEEAVALHELEIKQAETSTVVTASGRYEADSSNDNVGYLSDVEIALDSVRAMQAEHMADTAKQVGQLREQQSPDLRAGVP